MPRRVLVVDDSATLRRIMRHVLEAAGHEVETAIDGAEGLERAQQQDFDVVVVDFVMPRLNGYQLVQAMRALPALQRVPVVLASAKAEQIGERFMSQTGAAGVVQKPFTPDELKSAVAKALERDAPVDDEEDPFAGLVLDDDAGADPRGTPDARFHEARTVALPGIGPAVKAAAAALAARVKEPASAVHPRSAPASMAAPAVASIAPQAAPPRTSLASGAHPAQSPSRSAVEAAHARFTELLAHDLLPAFQDVADTRMEVTEDALVQILRFYLSAGRVASLHRELRPLEAGLRGNVVLDGLIESVPLGEVFQLLAFQSQTGLLVVERGAEGATAVTFALRNGRIDLAVGRGLAEEFRLGRYLIEMGVVSRAHVDAVLGSLAGQRVLLGQALVTGGFMRETDLERALERQTCEMLYEVLRWSGGRFRFEAGSTLGEAQLARLGLPSEGFVLEGYRRLDEWRMIGEYLPSDGMVFTRDESVVSSLPRHELHVNDQRVLDAIDGRRSVRDVVDAVNMSSFDAFKILYRLLQARLVAPVAA
jgi:CheY-like chemotaxis protein